METDGKLQKVGCSIMAAIALVLVARNAELLWALVMAGILSAIVGKNTT